MKKSGKRINANNVYLTINSTQAKFKAEMFKNFHRKYSFSEEKECGKIWKIKERQETRKQKFDFSILWQGCLKVIVLMKFKFKFVEFKLKLVLLTQDNSIIFILMATLLLKNGFL